MPEAIDKLFLNDTEASHREFLRRIDATAQSLVQCFQANKQAFSGKTPQELQALLGKDELLPQKGIGDSAVLKQVSQKILPHSLKVTSPHYMAHLHCAPLTDNIMAELILSTLNQSMDSWDQAPMATELEVHVIDELCRLYGYPSTASGVFTSGGSQSNLMGLFLGRDWFCKEKLSHDVRSYGLPSDFNKLRIYTSRVSHFSVEKSAHLMGMGFHAVRPVPVDEHMKMSLPHLRQMLEEDVAQGNIPMMIVATVGTTDFGSIDPLAEIRTLADQYGMWMHADAAYGSGLMLSEKYAPRLKGLEKADSITVDFHKMFMMSVSCGAFLLRQAKYFELQELHADYLNREEDEEEGYVHLVGRSLQTTRRFDALKVWMTFKSLGRETLGGLINRSVETCKASYDHLIQDDDFEAVTTPEISSLVFRFVGKGLSEDETEQINISIRSRLLHDKGIVIGQTKVHEKTFLKLTLLNPLIEPEDITELFALIKTMAV